MVVLPTKEEKQKEAEWINSLRPEWQNNFEKFFTKRIKPLVLVVIGFGILYTLIK